jgi:transglycosylase-like protein
MRRVRKLLVVLAFVGGGAALALWAAQPYLEQRVDDYIAQAGAAAGITIGAVHFSWSGPLRLDNVIVDRPDTGRVRIERADVRWDFAGGREPRAHVRGFDLRGIRMQRGPLTMELSETAFDVVSWDVRDGIERLRLRQVPGGGEFDAQWRTRAAAPDIGLTLAGFDLASARVRWSGDDVLQPGAWTGNVAVSSAGRELTLRGDASGQGVRIKLPPSFGGAGEFGAPVAVHLVWEAVRGEHSIDVRELDADLGGLVIDARGRVDGLGPDAVIAAKVSARTDLGAAFQATGIQLPVSMEVAPTDRLGTASGELVISGPLWRPAELLLTPELRFESTPGGIEKLQFLDRPFRYEPPGSGVSIEVRAGAPDFISIAAVPPLFLDALLLSEDAGFYGHPGVDVAEIRAAWAENAERGTFARGGSTITQQLVKNLFLSKEKSYGRKMEEAALALLVDAALPKRRILEIYLNVIEWGPGLYGLVPAARHYFGKPPGALTAKEIAFLVCLIPSPVRYHQAHTAGHAGPGMEQLMGNLLAKLRSIAAIGEDDYFAALDEDLRFAPEIAS